MAERAEAINGSMDDSVNLDKSERTLAPVVPVRTEPEPIISPPSTVEAIKERASAGLGEAVDRAARSYSAMADKSNAMFSDLKRWAQQMCRENPLQVVAIVAGTAFVLGFALRVWNSRRQA
jgi:ElaB/YqjD/DUF883 family membrane-anchored ribosome-binding protein